MAKKPVVPTRVRRLVAFCEAGRTVCLSLRHSEAGDERCYWLEPSGRPVGEWTVNKAIEMGLLAPSGDSLFAGIESQTYRLASA